MDVVRPENVHHHSKSLTLDEKMEASIYRNEIIQVVNRLQPAYETFRNHHNSGYCAYELLQSLQAVERQYANLRTLLIDLGGVEHYNFEAALAAIETEVYVNHRGKKEERHG